MNTSAALGSNSVGTGFSAHLKKTLNSLVTLPFTYETAIPEVCQETRLYCYPPLLLPFLPSFKICTLAGNLYVWRRMIRQKAAFEFVD